MGFESNCYTWPSGVITQRLWHRARKLGRRELEVQTWSTPGRISARNGALFSFIYLRTSTFARRTTLQNLYNLSRQSAFTRSVLQRLSILRPRLQSSTFATSLQEAIDSLHIRYSELFVGTAVMTIRKRKAGTWIVLAFIFSCNVTEVPMCICASTAASPLLFERYFRRPQNDGARLRNSYVMPIYLFDRWCCNGLFINACVFPSISKICQRRTGGGGGR